MKKEQAKPNPITEARSSIRRRPPYARRRTPPSREPTQRPRLEREPAPSVGFNGLREGRQSENRTVPPVATLLESASDTRARASSRLRAHRLRNRERDEPDALGRSERGAQAHHDLPEEWENWTQVQRQDWLSMSTIARDRESYASASPRSTSSRSTSRPRNPNAYRMRWSPMPAQRDAAQIDSLFVPVSESRSERDGASPRVSHPLSSSWPPQPQINGLGDRNRSPTPGDGWETMRATIAPDAHLPSADSSFTSAAASHSFNSMSTNTDSSSSANSRHTSDQGERSESVSSIDPDDICDENDRNVEADVASALYAHEMTSDGGRQRVTEQYAAFEADGGRRLYATEHENLNVEIGFRLINDALETDEGRHRLDAVSLQLGHGEDFLSDVCMRIMYRRWEPTRRDGPARITDDRVPSPHPERYSASQRAVVRQTTDQVHDYFSRFTADSLTHAARSRARANSPPPRYEPLASHLTVDTFVSRDAPVAHPVSPPSARSERDMGEALLEGNESDLEPMRRIVERLAARDDVPDEWWMSMGLNLSRSRVGSRSPARRHREQQQAVAAGGVRSGRVERRNSRL